MKHARSICLICVLLFSALFFYFYPTNYGIVDEAAYLTTTYTLARGELYYDKAGLGQVPMMVVTTLGHAVSKYPPGNSILLLPFSAPGWKYVFVRGYLLMLVCLVIFISLLAHYKISSIYALLFLFFPPLILFSRTTMSDLPAMCLALAGLYCFVTGRRGLSGVFFCLGVYVRYPMAVLAAAMAIALIVNRQWRGLLVYSACGILSLVPLAAYHLIIFKDILGPAFLYGTDFGLPFRWGTLWGYLLSMTLLYPLMLVLPFFSKGKDKSYFLLAAVIYIITHAFQSYIDTGADFFSFIILGQRYMLPIIPFLLVPYITVIDRVKAAKPITLVVSVVLFLLSIGISYKHQIFLKKQDYYQEKLYKYCRDADLLICNKDIFELVNPYIKYIGWVPFEKQRKLTNVNIYKHEKKRIYLGCRAHDEGMEKLFHSVLEEFPSKLELFREDKPDYFSIWRVNAAGDRQ